VSRIASVTLRFAVVALAGALAPPAARADEAYDPAADLRKASTSAVLSPEERLALARKIATAEAVGDAEAAFRVAAAVFEEDMATATALVRLGREAGHMDPSDRERLRTLLYKVLQRGINDAATADQWGAMAITLGRPQAVGTAPTTGQRPGPIRDALAWAGYPLDRLPLGAVAPPGLEREFEAAMLALSALDRADSDDPKEARAGLDALLAKKDIAVPLLLSVATPGPKPTPPGLLGRRTRAIAVLGMTADRRATPVLSACLSDAQPGWVRVAAAYALGDLGDPAALPALTRALFYLGDRHRPRDSWDFPGEGETDVPAEQWPDVEYYAIDVGVADALLRLGVPGAAGWLIRERLDPRKGRWRVRVPQDATDAIRRAFEGAPASYRPDAGLPERMAAWEELLVWWAKTPKPRRTLDEADPATRAAIDAIVARVVGKNVMELQIAEKSLELLGSAATPSLLAAVPGAGRVGRMEIAATLGLVRDPRAVEPLLALSKDEARDLRVAAARALSAYVEGPDGVREPVLARLVAMLDDPEEGPRAAALAALAVAPPRAEVRAAVEARAAAKRPENAFDDWRRAEAVVLLVQTGDGLPAVLAGLEDPVLLRRRSLWDVVRAALRLPPDAFDPGADPAKGARLDPARARDALERRREAP
jgi:HEAT repeat protein